MLCINSNRLHIDKLSEPVSILSRMLVKHDSTYFSGILINPKFIEVAFNIKNIIVVESLQKEKVQWVRLLLPNRRIQVLFQLL